MKNISLENPEFLGIIWLKNVLLAVFQGLESVTQVKWTVND